MTELFLSEPVYIPSIEGSDIYENMFRGKEMKVEYIGMIPSSLELNKLISLGLKPTQKKTSKKQLSADVINVKFKQKVDSGGMIIKRLNEKINGLNIKIHKSEKDIEQITDETDKEKAELSKQKTISYRDNLNLFINKIKEESKQKESKTKWKGVKNDKLRSKLYVDGFTLTDIDKKTGEIVEVKYIVYKRSSAKSRIGQCLFIKETFHEEMIRWSRMDLEFKGMNNFDYPSALAYESLVGSSIESIIKIKPENILIVDDVVSEFKQICNVIRTGEDGFLDSFVEESIITNSLFDGESLLCSSYFPEGKSMMLLRNHMFKSAAFNCNLEDYFIDRAAELKLDYQIWEIPNMFGELMLAKNVHLIITPSSLKALKFSDALGSKKDMWNYWKDKVSADECQFGVCKSEKKSKHGFSDDGDILQQTSYQMLNSLPSTQDDMKILSVFEREFIEKLKNNDDFFIQYIKDTANAINTNMMFVDIYERNKEIVRTKLFRKFRTEAINAHLTHVKKGKLRLQGCDYLVMLGNPMEYLSHAIGKLDLNSSSLKGNEVSTTLFNFDREVFGFRNPHTSPSNVLVAKNTYVRDIEFYFNLSDNIVCVNAIDFPLQDILSSCDYDSDTVMMGDQSDMLEICKKVFGKYRVCINDVDSEKPPYQLCNEDMARIDNELSKSQKYIGRTVNLGQLCMSTYWDLLSKGKTEDELEGLMKKIDVMTVLSCICIDMAKKMYEIDIKKEIDHVAKIAELKPVKPLFWKYVSDNQEMINVKYNCPMDYLFEEMNNIDQADKRINLSMKELLVKKNTKKGNRHQSNKIIEYVEEKCFKINNVYSKYNEFENLTKGQKKERDGIIDDTIKYYNFYVSKLEVNEDTMYSLLLKIANHKKDRIAARMLSILHTTQKDMFLAAFKSTNVTP